MEEKKETVQDVSTSTQQDDIDQSRMLLDEKGISRLQDIIHRYYKMNIKCDLILYKLNKIRKMQEPVG